MTVNSKSNSNANANSNANENGKIRLSNKMIKNNHEIAHRKIYRCENEKNLSTSRYKIESNDECD